MLYYVSSPTTEKFDYNKAWIEPEMINCIHAMNFEKFYVLYKTYNNDFRLLKGGVQNVDCNNVLDKIPKLLNWIEDNVIVEQEKANVLRFIDENYLASHHY